MKKLLFLLPGLCLLASWSVAETIESVSFNPSRLGRYENLKVSDTLKTKGGIKAQAVTVQSAASGTVDLNNNQNYEADQVAVSGKIDMPSTRFVSSSLESKGSAAFINKSSSASSSIETLDTEVARLKGNVLKLGSVVVTGASAQDFDGNQMSGLTLGGNNIPVADSSCKNLQWVSRVADDGNAYKVLAFGSCNGEESSCETSYGSWVTASLGMTPIDTCNGSQTSAFSCALAPRAQETFCTDVRTTSTTASFEGGWSSPQLTTIDETDTCDGDTYAKYTGVPSEECVDVYADTTGSQLLGTDSNAQNRRCYTTCMQNKYWWFASHTKTEWTYVKEHGIGEFCARYISGSPCKDCMEQREDGTPPLESNQWRTWQLFQCDVKYYKRSFVKGGDHNLLKIEFRNVHCCGDETGTIGGGSTGGGTWVPGGSVGGIVSGGNISGVTAN